jgi:hypothetical protein
MSDAFILPQRSELLGQFGHRVDDAEPNLRRWSKVIENGFLFI